MSVPFWRISRSMVSERNDTDPSPRSIMTPPGWADESGVLQLGWSCQLAVTGGLGVWRTVVRLKHRQSVSSLPVVCSPVDEHVPLPLGMRLFFNPIVGPLSGIAVRFWVFPRRNADCSPMKYVFDSPSVTSPNLRALPPGNAPPPDQCDDPGGTIRSVDGWLLLPARAT